MARTQHYHGVTAREHEKAMTQAERSRYRRAVAETRAEEKKIKTAKRGKMRAASTTCQVERKAAAKKVSAKCAQRRGSIRDDAELELGKQKSKRTERRMTWLYMAGSIAAPPAGEIKYSHKESDSMALHGLHDRTLEGLFMKTRKRWPYTKPPDMRAEAFNEWVSGAAGGGTEPEAVINWRIKQAEKSQLAYARDYEKSLRARGEWQQDLEEAVPF